MKKSDLHTFKVMPKPCELLLGLNRRLWKNCERKLSTSNDRSRFAHPCFKKILDTFYDTIL